MTKSAAFALLLAALPLPGQTGRTPRHEMRERARASGDRTYDAGLRALDAGRWDDAMRAFSEAAAAKGSHADGALYWKAYTQNRLGQADKALATIADLRRDYAASAWLNDAQALEQEIRQKAGQPVDPNAEGNDDLKLMALNGLLHSDPDRALPLIEKLLMGANPPRLKERAMFVLTQSKSPRARQLLTKMASGGTNPDLRIQAIRYMGITGGKENQDALAGIYAASNDVNVKRAVLRSYLTGKGREPLLTVAKTEKNADLRREAIRMLGVTGGADGLVPLYGAESDTGVRKEIVTALFIQRDAKTLVELARKESNPEMKKDIVQKLSVMRSKESADYMLELLNK